MSRMTYIILQAHTGTQETQLTQENPGRGFGKNAGEWTGRVKINKDEMPGSRRSMHGYVQTCSRLKRENL